MRNKEAEFDSDKYNELLQIDADKAAVYKSEFDVPDVLYKYISLDEFNDEENEKRFKTLSEKSVWCSKYNLLNDPFEFKGIYFDRNRLLEAFDPAIYDELEKTWLESFVISSFTSDKNNMPMWAHYANNHQGFCIECSIGRKVAVQKVSYIEKRQPIANILVDFFNYCKEFEKTGNKEAFQKIGYLRTLLFQMYLAKHQSWQYENEYRLVYPLENEIKENGLKICLDDIGICIKSIYCGIKCKKEHIDRLNEIASQIGADFRICTVSDEQFIVAK